MLQSQHEVDISTPDLNLERAGTSRSDRGGLLTEFDADGSAKPINQNDGNNNFKKGGMFSNRLDLLTEFDVDGSAKPMPCYGHAAPSGIAQHRPGSRRNVHRVEPLCANLQQRLHATSVSTCPSR